MVRSLAALAAALILGFAADAVEAAGVAFAGGTASSDPSLYAGALVPLPGARLGQGLAIRGSGNAGRYAYDAAGNQIKGRYVGGEISLMMQTSGEWGNASVAAGPRYSYTQLRPDDRGNRRRGFEFDALLTSDGALRSGAWRADWYGAYGVGVRDYQARLGVAHTAGPRLQLGIEAGVQGDRSYSRRFGGPTLTIGTGRSTFRLAAGISDQKSRGTRAYLSIGLSRTF